ncbi:uncharacterized protein LOC117124280 isoform X3 [Anneissia japonica]|uniref:uncharacterized protein LOC117124280 isoform X3 n=1 Tax=Anneissia japonica TaxID=1529436 RepID=UPI0014258CC6|nr:uncharacterized protein LOC117124280 isoform X3 [Anneissia japonica]
MNLITNYFQQIEQSEVQTEVVVEDVTQTITVSSDTMTVTVSNDTIPSSSQIEQNEEEAVAIDTLLSELSAVDVHTYKILPEGSQRHRPLLIDSSGNKYNKKPIDKRTNSKKITWTCHVRRKGVCCLAKVAQIGDTFIPGSQPHNHAAVLKAKPPKPENVEGVKVIQPRHPKTIKFYMNGKHVPTDFLIADVEIPNARHLLFATPEQRKILKKSKTLFADVTCKLMRDPFKQIFTLSTYLKEDDNVKQYILLFVVMSRKTTSDYIAVLEKIGELIPRLKVKKVILGYDEELWEAFDTIFPDVILQGCVYHWTEAVYMQVVNLGLNLSYTISSPVFTHIKELLALPFLPAEHILTIFQEISSKAQPALLPLIEYFQEMWMNNPQWPIISWCVYGMATRTINDVEGWHHRLVPKASLNRLIGLLWEEAQLVTPQKRPFNFEKLTRYQRKCRTTRQSKFFKLWAKYENEEITLNHLLKLCCNLNNPL